MNETILKFGYPQTLVAEYDHWAIMVRDKQITAGCLILAAKGDAKSFPELSPTALSELAQVTGDLERALRSLIEFERINYVALMMVDPFFHFHVIPRHSSPRGIAGRVMSDAGWPKHPNFGSVNDLTAEDLRQIQIAIRQAFSE